MTIMQLPKKSVQFVNTKTYHHSTVEDPKMKAPEDLMSGWGLLSCFSTYFIIVSSVDPEASFIKILMLIRASLC